MLNEKYSESISLDWLWRERELRDLDSYVVRKMSNIDAKLVIVLSYSHWEGHFKFCASQLLSFISEGVARKVFHWTDIKEEVRHRLLFCNYRKAHFPTQKQETFLNYLNALSDKRYNDILAARDEIIMIDDNLNSSRAEAICRNLGLSADWCLLKRIIIDERLLEYRNAIAHGSRFLRSGDEIKFNAPDVTALLDEVKSLIRESKNRFQNAIDCRHFLTS